MLVSHMRKLFHSKMLSQPYTCKTIQFIFLLYAHLYHASWLKTFTVNKQQPWPNPNPNSPPTCDIQTWSNNSTVGVCVWWKTHLGQEKQRSARPRVGVLIPQLEQFGREDGRREETQEKEAADGQILDVLRTRRQLTGRGQEAWGFSRRLTPATSQESDVRWSH